MAGRVLVTGGAGYVGSHTTVLLLEAGWDVVVFDDLSNGRALAVARAVELSGRPAEVLRVDVRDRAAVARAVRARGPFDACLHFAAKKSVAESVLDPSGYHATNVGGTIALIEALVDHGTRRVVYSSSATVYGAADGESLGEDAPLAPVNPYGQSKALAERALCDAAVAHGLAIALLRYFNPVGAHPSGRIGEDPRQPGNLLPLVARVALGELPAVEVLGTDWPTPDGTGVRDYVHVMDVARAHLHALTWTEGRAEARAFNIGTGQGASVREVVTEFRRASGRSIPTVDAARRPGDVARLVACPARARSELGFVAEHDLASMVGSVWRWARDNPHGYGDAL